MFRPLNFSGSPSPQGLRPWAIGLYCQAEADSSKNLKIPQNSPEDSSKDPSLMVRLKVTLL